MKTKLCKYTINGKFQLSKSDSLKHVCNAPKDKAGVYVISNDRDEVIYIGCSGAILKNGELHLRKQGLYGRIVNGKQFDDLRYKSYPIEMSRCGFKSIKIEWYVTFEQGVIEHSPAYVEALLLQTYYDANKKLPLWNKKF